MAGIFDVEGVECYNVPPVGGSQGLSWSRADRWLRPKVLCDQILTTSVSQMRVISRGRQDRTNHKRHTSPSLSPIFTSTRKGVAGSGPTSTATPPLVAIR